jgi:hypothetical protein
MIFEKNAKTGELAFSKSFLLMVSVWLFLMTLKETSSEVFLNGNVAFLLPFLINLLIVYPTVKKFFNLHKKFSENTYFLYNIIFSWSSKRPKRKYQQKSFLKHQSTCLSIFFKNYAFFIWVFPDFVDTLYVYPLARHSGRINLSL